MKSVAKQAAEDFLKAGGKPESLEVVEVDLSDVRVGDLVYNAADQLVGTVREVSYETERYLREMRLTVRRPNV